MSKYPIKINYPAKQVNGTDIEKFYSAIRSADIDHIRNFVNSQPLHYNIVKQTGKHDATANETTPIHVVLELTDQLANDAVKLEIIKYLYLMGCPMELPNNDNVWPIHLAASLQSEPIVNYLLSIGCVKSRKDNSNNTPLHRAIIGKEVNCPINENTLPLITTPSTHLSTILNQLDQSIMQLLATNEAVNPWLVHLINTIDKIPQMVANNEEIRSLKNKSLLNNETYPTNEWSKITKLEQLTEKIVQLLLQKTFKNLIQPLNIGITSTGWGLETSDVKIMSGINEIVDASKQEVTQLRNELNAAYPTLPAKILEKTIQPIITETNQYLMQLIFCEGCDREIEYALPVNRIKMFYLAVANDYRTHYFDLLLQSLMDQLVLINPSQYISLLNNYFAPSENTFFTKDVSQILSNNRNIVTDNPLNNDLISLLEKYDDRFQYLLAPYLANSNDNYVHLNNIVPVDEKKGTLEHQPLGYLVSKEPHPFMDVNDISNAILDNSWFDNLLQFIRRLQPRAQNKYNKQDDINDVFWFRDTRNREHYIIPVTPLFPSDAYTDTILAQPPNKGEYTYYELIRIMYALEQFIVTGNINITAYPKILARPVNQWNDYLFELSTAFLNNGTIGEAYPLFIILYQTLMTKIKNTLLRLMIACFEEVVQINNGAAEPLPFPANFNQPVNDTHLLALMLPPFQNGTILNPTVNSSSIGIIDVRNMQLPTSVINRIAQLSYPQERTDLLGLPYINDWRRAIELDYTEHQNEIDLLITNKHFINMSNRFFVNTKVRQTYQSMCEIILVANFQTDYLQRLRDQELNGSFFLVTMYTGLMVEMIKAMQVVQALHQKMVKVFSDIAIAINDQFHYYIAQIYLPSLVKLFITTVVYLVRINNLLANYLTNNAIFYNLTNHDALLQLGNTFITATKTNIELVYVNLKPMIAYLNDVVDYLNLDSAVQLMQSVAAEDQSLETSRFFTNNLTHFSYFPAQLNDLTDDRLKTMVSNFAIGETTYYDGTDAIINHLNNVDNKYRSIISYHRVSTHFSHSPTINDNLQINIVDHSIKNVPSSIAGRWLIYHNNGWQFNDAFIGFYHQSFVRKLTDGMPLTISNSLANYVRMVKQFIVQLIVPAVIDDQIISQTILNDLNASPTGIAVLIAQKTDKIIDQFIEYSLRQAISQTVYDRPNELTNASVRNYKASTLFVNEPLMEKQLDQLPYVTPKTNKQLIHHLYNIAYYLNVSKIESRCYQVDPAIIQQLIDVNTINARNSDGNTPLHLAINQFHAKLIKLLLTRGANLHSYPNLRNETPFHYGINLVTHHLQLSTGTTVIQKLNHFVITFNDQLITALKDARFGLNIIKNITAGIPIFIVMRNHLLNTFLQNYLHGFNQPLKEKINQLLDKYLSVQSLIYPTDLANTSPANQTTVNELDAITLKAYQQEWTDLTVRIKGLMVDAKTDPSLLPLIENLTRRYDDLTNQLTENIDLPIITPAENTPTLVTNRSFDIIQFYLQSFKDVDSHYLIHIWQSYLTKPYLSTASIICPLIDTVTTLIIGQMQSTATETTKTDLLTIVCFYKQVSKYILTKNKSSSLVNNLSYWEEWEQLAYLINLVLTPMIEQLIVDVTFVGLKELDPIHTHSLNKQSFTDHLIGIQLADHSLHSYLTKVLPMAAIQHYTQITFPARYKLPTVTSFEQLFEPVLQLIKANNLVTTTDQSSLIQNYRQTFIPFIEHTYGNFIASVRTAIRSYEYYLLNTYKNVKMLYSLAD